MPTVLRASSGPVHAPSTSVSGRATLTPDTKRAPSTILAFVESVRVVGGGGAVNYRVLATHGRGEEVTFTTEIKVAMGDLVRLTRSTTKRLYRVYQHPVSFPRESSSRNEDQSPLLKGWVRAFNAATRIMLVKTRFSLLTLTLSDDEILLVDSLSKARAGSLTGFSILFRPCFTDGRLSSSGITEVVAGSWPQPDTSQSGPTCEVFETESLLSLSEELGFNTSYQVPADVSPLEFKDYELTSCISVPEVPLLDAEERILESYYAAGLGSVSQDFANDAEYQKLLNEGLHPVVTALGDVGKLIRYLDQSLRQIDDMGLVRRVDVLYPVDPATTHSTIRTTISTKLMNPYFFPYIESLDLLENPLPLQRVYRRSGVPTGRVRLQHFAVIRMHVRPRCSMNLPCTRIQANPIPERFSKCIDTSSSKSPCPDEAAVKLLVPKGAVSFDRLRDSLPSGTLIHKVPHSMQASYTAYVITFSNPGDATHFISYIAKVNRSSEQPGPQWMVAPMSGFRQSEQNSVLTLFGTYKLDKNIAYNLFEAKWAYPINHNQIRFCSPLPFQDIVSRACDVNASSQLARRPRSLLKLMNDHEEEIDLTLAYGSPPVFTTIYTSDDDTDWFRPFPGATSAAADSLSRGKDEKHIAAPRRWIEVTNVPLTTPYPSVRDLVASLTSDYDNLSIGSRANGLSVVFSTLDTEALSKVGKDPVITHPLCLAFAQILDKAPAFNPEEHRTAFPSLVSFTPCEALSEEQLAALFGLRPSNPLDADSDHDSAPGARDPPLSPGDGPRSQVSTSLPNTSLRLPSTTEEDPDSEDEWADLSSDRGASAIGEAQKGLSESDCESFVSSRPVLSAETINNVAESDSVTAAMDTSTAAESDALSEGPGSLGDRALTSLGRQRRSSGAGRGFPPRTTKKAKTIHYCNSNDSSQGGSNY